MIDRKKLEQDMTEGAYSIIENHKKYITDRNQMAVIQDILNCLSSGEFLELIFSDQHYIEDEKHLLRIIFDEYLDYDYPEEILALKLILEDLAKKDLI